MACHFNTHPQALSNKKLLTLIAKYRLRHHFDKIEILPKSDGKTLGQDMLCLTSHCREVSPRSLRCTYLPLNRLNRGTKQKRPNEVENKTVSGQRY